MGLASGHCGLEHAGDPNPGNGFADFDYAGAPGGQNINTLLSAPLSGCDRGPTQARTLGRDVP